MAVWSWGALFVSTTAFSGFLPWAFGRHGKAGGTLGTIVAFVLLLFMWAHQASTQWVVAIAIGSYLVGLLCVRQAEQFMFLKWGLGARHTGEIVKVDRNETNIDEFHGMFVAGLGVWVIPTQYPVMAYANLCMLFLLFRLFDALKPWPVSWAEERFKGSPTGIMLDDTVAGLVALLLYVVTELMLHLLR